MSITFEHDIKGKIFRQQNLIVKLKHPLCYSSVETFASYSTAIFHSWARRRSKYRHSRPLENSLRVMVNPGQKFQTYLTKVQKMSVHSNSYQLSIGESMPNEITGIL